jgi:hypothetical protein
MIQLGPEEFVAAFITPVKDDVRDICESMKEMDRRLRDIEGKMVLLMWIVGVLTAVVAAGVMRLIAL